MSTSTDAPAGITAVSVCMCVPIRFRFFGASTLDIKDVIHN